MAFNINSETHERQILIEGFKGQMQEYDRQLDRLYAPSNTANSAAPAPTDLRLEIHLVRSLFFVRITVSYRSEVILWRDVDRPLREIEDELYRTIKDLGNEGYLPEGFLGLATTLLNESQLFGDLLHNRFEVLTRINYLISGLDTNISRIIRECQHSELHHDQSHPSQIPCLANSDFEINHIHVRREPQEFHLPPSDLATIGREAAERERRLQTYERERERE